MRSRLSKGRQPYLGANAWLAKWDGSPASTGFVAPRSASTFPSTVISGLGKIALRGNGSSQYSGGGGGGAYGLDFSAAVPFTVYLVVTPRGSDITGQKVLWSANQDAANRIYGRYATGGEIQITMQQTSYSALNSSGLGLSTGTAYVMAFEFSSTTELKVYVNGSEAVSGTVVARDPGVLYGWWTHFLVGSGVHAEQDLSFYGVQLSAHDESVSTALAAEYGV